MGAVASPSPGCLLPCSSPAELLSPRALQINRFQIILLFQLSSAILVANPSLFPSEAGVPFTRESPGASQRGFVPPAPSPSSSSSFTFAPIIREALPGSNTANCHLKFLLVPASSARAVFTGLGSRCLTASLGAIQCVALQVVLAPCWCLVLF